MMRFHRPATAYLERAMRAHLAKANDESRPLWIREMNRQQAKQLEDVIRNDIRKALLYRGWFGVSYGVVEWV
jgi:hypothetical protein